MRMVVLGAGASHGASDYVDRRVPLVEDFFETADDIGLADERWFSEWVSDFEKQHDVDLDRLARQMGLPGTSSHLAILMRFVDEQLDVSPEEYGDKSVNIERLMGLVEAEALGRHGVHRAQHQSPPMIATPAALEMQLNFIVCATLIATTRGVQCDYHSRIATFLRPDDCVVSFNYDLLIDRALAQEGFWYREDGYALDFDGIGGHGSLDRDWQDPLHTRSRVKLYKLHGSLNWLYPRSPWEAQSGLDWYVDDVPEADDVLYCLRDMNGDLKEDNPAFEWAGRYEHWEEGEGYDLYSLIVPPSITKHYREWETYLGPLWAEVLKRGLFEVEEIVFVGYSFREEDLRTWWLFKKIASEGEKLRSVRVVNPSDEAVEKCQKIFGEKRVERHADTLEQFAAAI